MKDNLLVIGGGTMGGGIVKQLLKNGAYSTEQCAVVERDEDKISALKSIGVRIFADLSQCSIADYRAILLAVKPQDASELLAELKNKISREQLVISIMAGVSLQTLEQGLAKARVVRTMPNIAATVGKGVIAWISRSATEDDRAYFGKIFGALGTALEVSSDDAIDRITAIAGCGPGYLYRFAQDLVQAAVALGIDQLTALRLVKATISGASALYEQSNQTPEELVKQVASKGGATEAALAVLNDAQTAAIWEKAVAAAYARAHKLGNNK